MIYLVKVVDACARSKVDDELRRIVICRFVRNDPGHLHQFFGSSAFHKEILQAGHTGRCKAEIGVKPFLTYFAGILLSSTTPPGTFLPLLSRRFLACTLTTTWAGFRKPTRTNSDNASASVIVALKSPVRRCFGRWVMMRVNAV